MKKTFISSSLTTFCILVSVISAGTAFAGWNSGDLNQGYNQRFGDFPPLDIDQKLNSSTVEDVQLTQNNTQQAQVQSQATFPNQANTQISNQPANTSAASTQRYVNQTQAGVGQPSQQTSQQPASQPVYGNQANSNNYQSNYLQPGIRPNVQMYNRNPYRRPSFNQAGSPWNNRSGFTGPMNNRGFGFGGPWNNNRSGFSGPWNNRGSGFSMPWGNNNGSGFKPMGNGGSWSW